MTAIVESPSDNRWQTLAGRAFLLAIAAILGRWVSGQTFGYILFAAAWGPISAIHLIGRPLLKRAMLAAVGGALIVSIPLLGWSFWTAIPLSLTLLLLCGCSTAMALATSRWHGWVIGQSLASLLWLAWLTVPIVMADAVSRQFSEAFTSRLLSIHPVLVLNQMDSRAGDWTHQSVAYRWLTRMGQDIPFEWPSSAWPFILFHCVVLIVSITLARGLGMFHVEHSEPTD